MHLNVNVTNTGESAYEAQLFVEHQESVTYIAASKGLVLCNRFNETVVACTLGNPMPHNGFASVKLRFDPTRLEDSAPQLSFKIFANSTSTQITPREKITLNVNVVKRAMLSIHGTAKQEQVFYSGKVVGESGMDYVEDIGDQVEHVFEIYNEGPWRVPVLNVEILWPHQVANDKEKGKWLLYLEDKPIIERANGECSIESYRFVNPLKLPNRPKTEDTFGPAELNDYHSSKANLNKTHNFVTKRVVEKESSSSSSSNSAETFSSKSMSSHMNRVKRDRAVVIRAERLVDRDGKKKDVVTMDCKKNTAKCVTLNCFIYDFPSRHEATIRIRSRLWNSTLVADYPRVDHVEIVSYAHISISEKFKIEQKFKNDWASVIL